MDELCARLLLYGDLGEQEILPGLCRVYADWRQGRGSRGELVRRVNSQVKALLDLAAAYGFDHDLWRDYLTWLLTATENSFSLTAERRGLSQGSINSLALADMQIFCQLMHFDFSPLERELDLTCLSLLQSYQASPQPERSYNQRASQLLRRLSDDLAQAAPSQMLRLLAAWYRDHGVGCFGLNTAFRLQRRPGPGPLELLPISNAHRTLLSDLVGCQRQTDQLRANTEAFLRGLPANNVLLYGDGGCGKSSAVKALLNEYGDQGLRMIEIYKHQFRDLSQLISQIKNRNYCFIIFIDDLSFEEDEAEYKFLKAVIEGGVESKPDNILIYATSNRRHLIREVWGDRADMEHLADVHRSDTLEEKLSLASRFGVQINFPAPDRQLFWHILEELACRQGLDLSGEELHALANQWSLRQGGLSGRTARQLINHLAGQAGREEQP